MNGTGKEQDMIYKRCPRCRKRIPSGTECDCIKKRHKEYDRTGRNRKTDAFYHSDDWCRMRAMAEARYMGMDIYSYYVLGKMEYGHSVHHIIPIKDDWSLRLNLDNLIYLTEKNHQKIHVLLNGEQREETIELLQNLVKRFKDEFDIADQGGI